MPAVGEFVKLSNGSKLPLIGLGTWQSAPGEVTAAVKHALKAGYRHVDAAAAYGNEGEVGDGIRASMQKFGIKREEIFVTSKLWNTKHHPDDVEPALKKTLHDLGLAYLDLYLMHWPYAFKRGDVAFPKNEDGSMQYDNDIHPTETWLAMEKLVKAGLVKSIGVSNFNSEQIQDILDKGEIKPVTNQVECHPYLNQSKLIAFCRSHDIVVTAYSPLGSPNRPWATADTPKLLDDPKLVALAEKYGKTAAQIVLRWQVQRQVVVIPKSTTPARIDENLHVFDFSLTDEEMRLIDSFDRGGKPGGSGGGRLIVPVLPNGDPRDAGHPHYPFNIEF